MSGCTLLRYLVISLGGINALHVLNPVLHHDNIDKLSNLFRNSSYYYSWMVLVIMDLRNNVFFVSDMELPAYEHPPLWIPPNEVFLNSNNA